MRISRGEPPGIAYLEHLAALVIHRLQNRPTHAGESRHHRPLESAFIGRADDYIRAHLDEDIAVVTLARLCGMRPDTFARQFQAATGKPPYAYVLECRIERAQHLLRTTPASLATVALDVGFASQSHLTTAFRRVTGSTPGRYRAQSRPKS